MVVPCAYKLAFKALKSTKLHTRSVCIASGFCPTVGVAGGYTQGGGHSPLASANELAADNTLEFEVVTTKGEHLIANPEQNSDLFWALSGGGGSTFAVVISMIIKTFKDGPVEGAFLSMDNTHTKAFWNIVTVLQTFVLDLNRLHGFQSAFTVTSTNFFIDFVTWPGHNGADVANALFPFTDQLTAHGFKYNLTTSSDSAYYKHYIRYALDIPFGDYTISGPRWTAYPADGGGA